MKKIPLTQGKFALVDDEDFNWLNQWKWQAHLERDRYYAVRNVTEGGRGYVIRMHRLIMTATNGQLVDHKDRDSLNNQRYNLRLCTNSQNSANSKPSKSGTSKLLGVSWNRRANKWQAQIMHNRKQKYLGLFVDENEAAKAYNSKAIELHGGFANLNTV